MCAGDRDPASGDVTRLAGTSVVIGVCTFRRPDRFALMLPLLIEQAAEVTRWARCTVSVLVVDNDPDGSAAELVARFARAAPDEVAVRYVIEPRPGIAAARQRVLDETTDADLLQFVDDDETPEPHWLRNMLRTWVAFTRPAAVAGVVRPDYQGTPEPWVVAGRFFVRKEFPTGTLLHAAPTSNLLLDLAQLRELGLAFDLRLGMRGGEDTRLTERITRSGRRIVYAGDAIVNDLVPEERSNRAWVLRRARHQGSVAAHLVLLDAPDDARRLLTRGRLAVGGLLRMVKGGGEALYGVARRDGFHHANGLRTLNKGLGRWIEAVRGTEPEYQRAEQQAVPTRPEGRRRSSGREQAAPTSPGR